MPKQRSEWRTGDPTVSVVGEGFCNPHPVELVVNRKAEGLSNDHYDVLDLTGNLLLQIDGSPWGFNRKRVMRDPAGLPLLTMRLKPFTLRHKWEVYGGESGEREDLLFWARQPHAVSLKTSLDVYLPDTGKHDVCDFRASGGYRNISFSVLKADALLATVKHKFSWGSFCKGKYSFRVRVNPEVDYAFIVALLVIIDDIENLR